MEASELKQYIIDKDLIVSVLEKLGCHKIKKNIRDIRCALPHRNNGTSVSVKLDTLSTTVFSEGDKVSGDIITLISHIKQYKTHSFIQSLKWLHEACNLRFTGRPTKKKDEVVNDPLRLFRDIKRNDISNYKNEELTVHDSNILSSYVMKPHIKLLDEGISCQTQYKYNVCYCPRSKRIVFPYRYHGGADDSYVGAIGRTTIKDFELFDIPKYFAMKPFPKGNTLYGYAENYETIQKSGKVIVFEAEKSTLMVDTFGYCNSVSIGSHSISDVQKNLLLGLNVEIVIGMDNDVSEKEVIEMCKDFSKYQRVSYIKDKDGVLGEKDSPTDKGYSVYMKLLENRIRVK